MLEVIQAFDSLIVGYYDPLSEISDEMEKLKTDINTILEAF